MDSGRCRRAAWTAWVCAGLHVLAIAGMVYILRHGLPPGRLADRVDFVQGHRAAWTAAWAAWMVTAVSVTVAFGFMARALGAGRAAVFLFAAGNIPDLCGLWIYITGPFASGCPDELLRVDRAGAFLNGALANGLYTLAWAGLVWRAPGLHRGLAVAGVAAGLLLTAASAARFEPGMVAATAVVMPAFTAWLALAGRFFWRNAR